MSKRTILAFAVLIVSLAAAVDSAAAVTPTDKPEYTNAQIHKLAREARTVQQFTVLADYYQTRRRMYQHRAAEEMHLLAERNAVMTPLSEK